MAVVERNESELGTERYVWALKQLDMPLLTIADVGCGLGYGSAILRQKHFVVGLDISRDAIAQASLNYPGPYLVANAEAQNFSGFDCVVCLECLSHMVDPYTWIKNLDVPRVVISAPLTPSSAIYPWRKHDIPSDVFKAMFSPMWMIADTFLQEPSGTERYLTIYAVR